MSGLTVAGARHSWGSRHAEFKRLSSLPILPLIAAIFFVMTFLIKALVDDAFTRGDVSAAIAYSKYITAGISCLAALAYALKRGEHVFVREFNALVIIVAAFTVLSVFFQICTGQFSSSVYVELFKLAMPVVLAYSILNALSQKAIYRCMVAVLLASVFGYVLSLMHEGVDVSAILVSEFENSESASESSTFSGIFLVLTFYFAFFRHQKSWLFLSALCCILTFKRLAVIATLFALAAAFFAPRLMRTEVPHGVVVVLKLLTIVAVALWTWMLFPGQNSLFIQIFQDTPSHFTMGRSDVLSYLLNSGFESYGFGSANEIAVAAFSAPFEMDLTKIAIELTPLAMVLFVCLFWEVAGTSVWGIVIVGYFMVNMITSDSLTSNFCLTLAYMTCGLVAKSCSTCSDGRLQEADNAR